MLKTTTTFLWVVTALLILYVGIYYTVSLKFPQFRWIKIAKTIKKKDRTSNTFQLLNLTLAGKIGVGSIAGIALCIVKGGLGSIFWLWVSALILASLSYVETKLGIKYRENIGGEYVGGPSFYIEKGLKKKNLAKLYSVLIIISYIFAFTSIQANTIVISLENIIPLKRVYLIFGLAILTYLAIHKGIKTISRLTSILVPLMGLLYIVLGILVILNNPEECLEIIKQILSSALSEEGLHNSILVPFIVGLERGIFSNEAGLGTTAIVSSLSTSEDQEKQANVQIIGTFFTSLFICTITALIVLTSNYQDLSLSNLNGIELVSYALLEHFGYPGTILLAVIIFLFAFSTIVTSYYYGESNLKYLRKTNKKNTFLKIIVIIVVIYSSFTSPTLLWNLVDLIVALIAIINVYTMWKLKTNFRSKE